ncbi:MAG: hypothetical protein QXJ28_02020 [Candidatus Pacearchaeota archaeon]
MTERTRIIEIQEKSGTFVSVFKKFSTKKEEYNFSDMSLLRRLLSNERARLLNVIKTRNPLSIYALAKILERDFKSVRDDVLLLKKFGFLNLVAEKSPHGNRIKLRPVLEANTIHIILKI